ncbi:MAG: hypothetical protein Q4E00_00130 [Actinomyces bowdenii]|nr:hypothetical protein [Actinomyces bowdenii]
MVSVDGSIVVVDEHAGEAVVNMLRMENHLLDTHQRVRRLGAGQGSDDRLPDNHAIVD